MHPGARRQPYVPLVFEPHMHAGARHNRTSRSLSLAIGQGLTIGQPSTAVM